ncbi:MAG: ABC transporter ATP-binding protein/permease [Clostridiales bacterium]|jgi:ATP-binding cassette subfamily B protein|nr:ABC transporter ATP-binding protein/permease [Clostridiales bacterium]
MIKRLAKCIRQYKWMTALAPAFMVGEVVMEVLIPRFMADLIDKGANTGDIAYIWRTGLLLLGCALLAMAFGVMSGTCAAMASAGFARNLRHDMFHNVQTFSFSNIDRFSTASLVTRMTTDVSNVQNSFQMMIRMAVRSPVMLILAFSMAFSVNAQLSAIFVAAVPVLGIGAYFIIGHVHPIFKRVFKTYDRLNNVVRENLRGIRVVKSFVREEHEKGKFDAISGDIYRDFTSAEKRLAFNMPLMQVCMYGGMLLIAWFGARLIVGNHMTTGQLMSMITYAMQILMSLMMLSMVFVMIIISRASAERIVEVLEEKADLANCESPALEVSDGAISFRNVDFSYAAGNGRGDGKPCLSGINLDIRSGETVGILGGTGSSKSTLVQLIPRLYDVTGGAVLVGGRDVREYDIESLRNAVAFVLQKNVLFSGTIKDNLRWGNEDATDGEMERACELAQADGFIRAFPDGYDTRIEQGGTNVSGGQRQRLCIARALLKKPKAIILDDSTSAVDTRTDAAIRQAFRERIPDVTKIIIAQRVASVQDADKIVVLDGGRVHAVGSHSELLASSGIYQEVYYSQTKGGDFDEAVSADSNNSKNSNDSSDSNGAGNS